MIKNNCLLFVIGLVLFISTTLRGQSVSPLVQIMNSSTLIDRPSEFREMQYSLREAMEKSGPGLKIHNVYSLVQSHADKMLDKLNATYAFTANTDIVIMKIENANDINITVPPSTALREVIYDICRNLSVLIEQELKQIPEIGNINRLRASLLSTVIKLLEEYLPINDNRYRIAGDGSTESEIAGLLSSNLYNELIIVLGNDVNVNNTLNATEICEILNKCFGVSKSIIRDKFIESINEATHKLGSLATDDLGISFTGSAGLGATENKGVFSSGLSVTYQHPKIEYGGFISGDLTRLESDSSHERGLVGIQIRATPSFWGIDFWQLDLVLSKSFQPDQGGIWEVGMGNSFRIGNELILGLSYCGVMKYLPDMETMDGVQHNEDVKSMEVLIGLTLRGTSKASPTLLLGMKFIGDLSAPVIELSTPIVPN